MFLHKLKINKNNIDIKKITDLGLIENTTLLSRFKSILNISLNKFNSPFFSAVPQSFSGSPPLSFRGLTYEPPPPPE